MIADLSGLLFERIGPSRPVSPLVVAVPHAGRLYPPALRDAAAVPMAVLEELEDRHADRLIARAIEYGAVAIVARIARAWIDLNRGEEDLDPTLHAGADGAALSARARSGLGLVPRRIGRRELWRIAPDAREVAHRIAVVHRPYHAALAQALAEARAAFGYAILLDCHSMPTIAGATPPDIVIGTRHGATAGRAVVAAIVAAARDGGRRVALNAPYAGAYSVARHGRPREHVHAIQIEIDRTLYLEPGLREPGAGVEAMTELVAAIGRAAIMALAPPDAIAAE